MPTYLLSSIILSPLVDQYVYLCGAPVHPLASKGGAGIGLEPPVSCVHSGSLGFLRIERVLGGCSMGPTRPRLPGLRTHTILRE